MIKGIQNRGRNAGLPSVSLLTDGADVGSTNPCVEDTALLRAGFINYYFTRHSGENKKLLSIRISSAYSVFYSSNKLIICAFPFSAYLTVYPVPPYGLFIYATQTDEASAIKRLRLSIQSSS